VTYCISHGRLTVEVGGRRTLRTPTACRRRAVFTVV